MSPVHYLLYVSLVLWPMFCIFCTLLCFLILVLCLFYVFYQLWPLFVARSWFYLSYDPICVFSYVSLLYDPSCVHIGSFDPVSSSMNVGPPLTLKAPMPYPPHKSLLLWNQGRVPSLLVSSAGVPSASPERCGIRHAPNKAVPLMGEFRKQASYDWVEKYTSESHCEAAAPDSAKEEDLMKHYFCCMIYYSLGQKMSVWDPQLMSQAWKIEGKDGHLFLCLGNKDWRDLCSVEREIVVWTYLGSTGNVSGMQDWR